MRTAAIAFVILLLPAALLAVPNIGIYFMPNVGQMSYSPYPYEEFNGYVYENDLACYITAVEFRIDPPTGIVVTGFDIPEGSLSLGDPEAGLSITYWPPLNGYSQCNMLCTLHFVAMKWCVGGGGGGGILVDVPLRILPHPETGLISAACYPENYLTTALGLTSTICPTQIGVHEKSWGAIKSLYE